MSCDLETGLFVLFAKQYFCSRSITLMPLLKPEVILLVFFLEKVLICQDRGKKRQVAGLCKVKFNGLMKLNVGESTPPPLDALSPNPTFVVMLPIHISNDQKSHFSLTSVFSQYQKQLWVMISMFYHWHNCSGITFQTCKLFSQCMYRYTLRTGIP